MENFSDILAFVTALDFSRKYEFYQRVGSALTVTIRSISFDSVLSDKEKIQAIKVVNELSHQVFNWTARLKNQDRSFSDKYCFEDIRNLARQNSTAAAEIGTALTSTYRFLLRSNQP